MGRVMTRPILMNALHSAWRYPLAGYEQSLLQAAT